ncbi:MAG: hypothetical protein AAFR81_28120, partial [Chloroflexota bacterium]
ILPAIERLILDDNDNEEQQSLYAELLKKEFERLIEESYDNANDKLVGAFSYLEKADPVTHSKNARQYLRDHWQTDKLGLVDAKVDILKGIKRWAQDNKLKSFSDKALADEIRAHELPEEVHDLARKLASFAGVKTSI